MGKKYRLVFFPTVLLLLLFACMVRGDAVAIRSSSSNSQTQSYAGNWIYIHCTYNVYNEKTTGNLQGNYVYHINTVSTAYSIDRPQIVYSIENGIRVAKGRPVIREFGIARTNPNYYITAKCNV